MQPWLLPILVELDPAWVGNLPCSLVVGTILACSFEDLVLPCCRPTCVGTFLVVPSCHLVACTLLVVASSAAAGTLGSIPKTADTAAAATAVHISIATAGSSRRQDLDRNRLD